MEGKTVEIQFETAKQLMLELLGNRDLTDEPEVRIALREALNSNPSPPIHIELSPITINEQGQILLKHYKGTELKLSYLSKTLYLFYLIFPEEVPISKLGAYRSVIYSIYERVSMRKDMNVVMIRRVVERLFDPTNNRVYELCSLIRNKLEKIVPPDALPYYIIAGRRGRGYSIGLSRNLISIHNKSLIDIENGLLVVKNKEDINLQVKVK